MINPLRKFGIWEYILFASGLLIISKLTYNFMVDKLEATAVNGIALLVGVLMISAPRFLIRKIKEKTSNLTRKK